MTPTEILQRARTILAADDGKLWGKGDFITLASDGAVEQREHVVQHGRIAVVEVRHVVLGRERRAQTLLGLSHRDRASKGQVKEMGPVRVARQLCGLIERAQCAELLGAIAGEEYPDEE